MATRVVEKFSRFRANRCDKGGKVEESIVWLGRVGAWIATVVKCSTYREAREDQTHKFYADTQGIMREVSMVRLNESVRVFL